MQKSFLTGTMILVLLGCVLLGQEAKKPYESTFDKGIGTCSLSGITFDQVWSACVKTLMADRFKIESLEKQSGLIVAATSTWTSFALTLFIEKKDQGISVTASVRGGEGNFKDSSGVEMFDKDVEKEFFDHLIELLFGKGTACPSPEHEEGK